MIEFISIISWIVAAFFSILFMYYAVMIFDAQEFIKIQANYLSGKDKKGWAETKGWTAIILFDIFMGFLTAFVFIGLYTICVWSIWNIVPLSIAAIIIYVIMKIVKKS